MCTIARKKREFGDFDDTFKPRRQLKRIAWARNREPHIYWRMVLLGLLPILIQMTFGGLAVAAGIASGFSTHHLEQAFKLTLEYNDRLLWTVLSGYVSGVFSQISIYTALVVVRKTHTKVDVAQTVVHHLSWRFVLSFIAINTVMSLVLTSSFIAGVIFVIVGVIVFGHIVWLGILLVTIAVVLMLFLPIWVSLGWSQTPFLIKERIDEDDTQGLFNVLKDSWRMMRGFKFDLFVVYLSLFWWYVLIILTFGIAWIFLNPYVNLLRAAFHENVRRFAKQRQAVGL